MNEENWEVIASAAEEEKAREEEEARERKRREEIEKGEVSKEVAAFN